MHRALSMMSRGVLPIGLALATSACTFEQSEPETSVLQSPIVGGVTDNGDLAVVEFADGCSAEVLSPHVLLTAGHCVVPPPSNDSMHIFTGQDDTQPAGGMTVQVKEVHAHPAYDNNADASPHDVGIVILQTPVAIKPLPINRTPLTADMQGKPVRIVGYGTTQANGADQGFGQRRQATSPLIGFDDDWVNVGTSTANQCFGDSGGPALMVIDGQEVIVGVDSFGSDAGDTCKEYNSNTRIDKEQDFIDPFIAANDPGSVVGGGGGSGGDAGGAPAGSGNAGAASGGNGGTNNTGGATSSGGALSGAGGSVGVGGSGGSVNSGAGGLSGSAGVTGGSAGVTGGSAGVTGGSVSGGTSQAGTSGTSADTGGSGEAPAGCSCGVVGRTAPGQRPQALWLALGAMAALRRRRRHSPRAR